MRWMRGAGHLIVAAWLLLAFQAANPLRNDPIGQAEGLARRPLPPVGPPAVAGPGQVWVPDRYIPVPGEPGVVHVPGHWERPLNPRENYVPPLVVCNPTTGECVSTPAGTRPAPPERRESP